MADLAVRNRGGFEMMKSFNPSEPPFACVSRKGCVSVKSKHPQFLEQRSCGYCHRTNKTEGIKNSCRWLQDETLSVAVEGEELQRSSYFSASLLLFHSRPKTQNSLAYCGKSKCFHALKGFSWEKHAFVAEHIFQVNDGNPCAAKTILYVIISHLGGILKLKMSST